MNKEDIKTTGLIFLGLATFIELLVIILNIIGYYDLKATAYGYESDRNLCRSQLDSLTQELERWQSE